MRYFGTQIALPTVEQKSYMAAHTVAWTVWAHKGGPLTTGLYDQVRYWKNRLNDSLMQTMALPAPDPVDEIAAALGLSSNCRQTLRTAGAGGLCLKTAARKVRKLRQSGAISGAGGVYITHERNRRGDKVYHRIRLNICAGGRRVRHDLGSYRVK